MNQTDCILYVQWLTVVVTVKVIVKFTIASANVYIPSVYICVCVDVTTSDVVTSTTVEIPSHQCKSKESTFAT